MVGASIDIQGLSARIRKTQILSDLSFKAGSGEFIALVGPNGAGKTTLLKHLNGLLKPSQGRVLVGGLDTRRAKTSLLARKVGFLFQNPDRQILCSTVKAEIEFGLKHCGIKAEEWPSRIASACAMVGLAAETSADPLMLPRNQRQRLALASVVATDPDILVLDEPTSAQDERETLRVMDLAKGLCKKGKLVILVSHDMEIVSRYASRVLALIDGRLSFDGAPEALFSDSGLLAKARLLMPGLTRLSLALGIGAPPRGQLNLDHIADTLEQRVAEARA